jgi:hypothetical protein
MVDLIIDFERDGFNIESFQSHSFARY